jgi:hypothetical protein
MWPDLNPHSSNLAFARVRCTGRRLPRTSPDVTTSCTVFVDPADPTPSRYSRVETFPEAACYRTTGSAMILPSMMRAVWQRAKAAPLQALGAGVPARYRR